jgi:hypothetical protein
MNFVGATTFPEKIAATTPQPSKGGKQDIGNVAEGPGRKENRVGTTQYPSYNYGEPIQAPPELLDSFAATAAQIMNAATTLKTGHHGVVGEYSPVILFVKNDETDSPSRPSLGQFHSRWKIGVEIHESRREKKQESF